MSTTEDSGHNSDVQVADDVPANPIEIENLSANEGEILEAPQEEAAEHAGQKERREEGYEDNDAMSEASVTSPATDPSSDASLPSGFLSPLHPFTVIPASFLTPLRPRPDEGPSGRAGPSAPVVSMAPKEAADEPVVPVPPAEDPVPPVVTHIEVPVPTPVVPVIPVTPAQERVGPSQP